MYLILRHRNTGPKPTLSSDLDLGHPMAKSLIFYAGANQSGGPFFDLISGYTASTVLPTWSQQPQGYAASNWKIPVNAGISVSTTGLALTTAPYTIAVSFYQTALVTGSSNFQMLMRQNYTNETTNQGWILSARGPTATVAPNKYAYFCFNNDGFANYSLATSTAQSVGNHLLVATCDGTTRRLYLDGFLEASSTTDITPLSESTNGLQSNNASTPVYWCAAWARCLSAEDIVQLWKSPYAMIRNMRRLWMYKPIKAGSLLTAMEI